MPVDLYSDEIKAGICRIVTKQDRQKMRELLIETQKDGLEHGFVRCRKGHYRTCTGNECSIPSEKWNPMYYGCSDDHPPDLEFHTHPSGGVESEFSEGDVMHAAQSAYDGAEPDFGTCIGWNVADYSIEKRTARCYNPRRLGPDDKWIHRAVMTAQKSVLPLDQRLMIGSLITNNAEGCEIDLVNQDKPAYQPHHEFKPREDDPDLCYYCDYYEDDVVHDVHLH